MVGCFPIDGAANMAVKGLKEEEAEAEKEEETHTHARTHAHAHTEQQHKTVQQQCLTSRLYGLERT